ncbi:hypothetical protein SDC9_152932 [bioreactor metagenome]|uniref:Uncharacterized protein n=1 Tax=bioreactor metagenome TaxID=1076179 RepID=A0A645EUH7_9ZZZZ
MGTAAGLADVQHNIRLMEHNRILDDLGAASKDGGDFQLNDLCSLHFLRYQLDRLKCRVHAFSAKRIKSCNQYFHRVLLCSTYFSFIVSLLGILSPKVLFREGIAGSVTVSVSVHST